MFRTSLPFERKVNITLLEEEPTRVVVHLEEGEYHSTWLGNKAIYRTRMMIADGGHLIVLAPGVRSFGEDLQIDRLIRKYGYRTTPEIMQFVKNNEDLRANLSAAAHMIHGSPENRFRVTYCPGSLSRSAIESVGYDYAELADMLRRYDLPRLQPGWNEDEDGSSFYFIRNPALGLWAARHRFEQKDAE